ncbi:MAG TPA: hypothetical protein O0X48_00055 [Methanocorpusculum sp.]|nr:hypothetical protein [Methanocorpusculum sp.]HJJ85391.1 hypothetical protein [Methanocorpusculum sp.]
MLEQLPYIAAATAICLILFVVIDFIFKLPKKGGVSGAEAIANDIEATGGNKHGGYMIGNIITSPDASAGTLLAACGFFIYGVIGAVIAAVLVFIGARICADKGYAGLTGALAATAVIWACTTFLGFAPETFIAGIVLAILIVEGLSLKLSSKIIGKLWGKRT